MPIFSLHLSPCPSQVCLKHCSKGIFVLFVGTRCKVFCQLLSNIGARYRRIIRIIIYNSCDFCLKNLNSTWTTDQKMNFDPRVNLINLPGLFISVSGHLKKKHIMHLFFQRKFCKYVIVRLLVGQTSKIKHIYFVIKKIMALLYQRHFFCEGRQKVLIFEWTVE